MSFFLASQMSWAVLPLEAANIDGARVNREAKNIIQKKWKAEGLEIQVEVLKGFDSLAVSAENIQWHVQWNGLKPYSGLMSLPIVLTSQGKLAHRSLLAVRTRLFRKVLVPIKNIDRHQTVSADDFVVSRVEIPSDIEPYLSSLSSLEKKRTTRRLLAHEPVFESTLETIPLIKKGDAVSLIIKNEGLEITAKGVAKMDGAIGDLISVMNLHSGQTTTALVNRQGFLEISAQDVLQ